MYRLRVARLLRVEVRTEVIAYEEGRRAVTKTLGVPEDVYVETTLSDEDGDGFVVLNHRSWQVMPAGTRMKAVRAKQKLHDRWAAEIGARLPLLRS